MLNFVMPIAGEGKRFQDAGYVEPKPLIPVDDMPMFSRVLENIGIFNCNFHLICQDTLFNKNTQIIDTVCKDWFCKNYFVHRINKTTEGAACTVLITEECIDDDEELLIANCDQLVLQPDYMKYALGYWRKYNADGGILCFFNDCPCWSYVNMDRQGWVRCVVEKQVVSNFATVGIYYYKHGKDFVRNAKRMIEVNDRINGEFYVAPVYNHFLKERDLVKILPYLVNDMYGLGTPEQLRHYQRSKK